MTLPPRVSVFYLTEAYAMATELRSLWRLWRALGLPSLTLTDRAFCISDTEALCVCFKEPFRLRFNRSLASLLDCQHTQETVRKTQSGLKYYAGGEITAKCQQTAASGFIGAHFHGQRETHQEQPHVLC